MYFYDEAQGMLGISELPPFNDESSVSQKDKMKVFHFLVWLIEFLTHFLHQSPKMGLKLLPIKSNDQGLQVNMDRNMKARSVAMIPSRTSNSKSGWLVIIEHLFDILI